jgi:hypothetical protein
MVLLVVSVREGAALTATNFLLALYAMGIEGQLIFTLFTDPF